MSDYLVALPIYLGGLFFLLWFCMSRLHSGRWEGWLSRDDRRSWYLIAGLVILWPLMVMIVALAFLARFVIRRIRRRWIR